MFTRRRNIMGNVDGMGTMKHRNIYQAILKNTEDGYKQQNISMNFFYETNREYDNHAIKITQINGFKNIKSDTELQTFINATNWVSHILRSDAQPTIENVSGYEIICNVQKGLYAANCYAHAVVLNDVFHLLGYKSKYVFCEPIDYHFTDNHVVNHVLSSSTHKWMLFDAAQGVYFTKKNGEVMNLQDLREYIIKDEPFEVNLLKEFWGKFSNREQQMIKNRIVVYMMKNLYRFECRQNSYTDRTSFQEPLIYYDLVPESYFKTPMKQVLSDTNTGLKHMVIYSSDETEFWKTPEV